MQNARIDGYKKDPSTNDIILHAHVTDAEGKPLPEEVEVRLSQDVLQKLIREELPTEEKHIQELLDKIHEVRKTRVLDVEKIDDSIKEVVKEADSLLKGANDKVEIMKYRALLLTKLSAITQRRHLARLAVIEESELSLQLAKLKHQSESEE
jgi:hypothetical protein